MTENRQGRRLGHGALLAIVLLAWALLPVTPARAGLPATGQTTPNTADKNNGVGLDAVPDDGTLQRGATLHYKLLNNGTIKDLNTGLIWEMKCSGAGCAPLHDVSNLYRWSGDGTQETIWDWLEDVNAEGGTGYAGRDDWRIPNVRELQSIVDYGVFFPPIDPIFGPTAVSLYWSSTTGAVSPSDAWFVIFGLGSVNADGKSNTLSVRAVRGGPK